MTIQERKVMKLALEALEDIANEIYGSWTNGEKAQRIAQNLIPTIKEALAQPEQREPTKQEHNILMGALKRSGKVVAQPKQEQDEPVAVVTGVYGGRFIVEPTNSAMVLPVNMALYAHPQRQRVVFPTMIRRMWSGADVQAWLDENVNKE